MKLGQLLAAGKSVVNVNGAIQYREDKQFILPKFVATRNQIAHSTKPSGDTTPAPVRDNSPGPADPQRMPPINAAPKSLAAWTGKLSPASVWPGPKAEPAHEGQPQFQSELSLDTVKVVHNDLSDADVEIVPIKSRAVPEANLPPAKKAWEILGERLLKVTAL
jgi:hypothetical protein